MEKVHAWNICGILIVINGMAPMAILGHKKPFCKVVVT